jgi:hypothetical protein
MIDAVFASVGMKELFRFLALFILVVAGWLLSAFLAFRLHFANDTIRMLRANALAVTPEERQAMWRAVAILNGGQQVGPDTPLAGDAATIRGLLERLK